MRRFLVIALMCLLPLQFSWAAVASYCGHEVSAQVEHLGHHEHRHDATGGHSGQGDHGADVQKTAGATDLDCAQCHGACFGLPGMHGPTGAAVRSTRPGAAADAAATALPPSPPERPQWPLLA